MQIDTGNRCAELLKLLKLFSDSAVPNECSHAGSPFEQSSDDASAEITGSSRYGDDRTIHDSYILEKGQRRCKVSPDPGGSMGSFFSAFWLTCLSYEHFIVEIRLSLALRLI